MIGQRFDQGHIQQSTHGNGRFFPGLTHVNMCKVMPVRVLKEHGHQSTVEQADGGHLLIV
jgi:hypothetical protein